MPTGTLFYSNDFDGNENIAGSLTVTVRPGDPGSTSGSNSFIGDSSSDSDPDNELVLYDGTQVGGYAEFAGETFVSNGSDPIDVYAASFVMTAQVNIIGFVGGSDGNQQVDGFSFNFGNTATLDPPGDGVTTPRQGALEQGVGEGLAIRVKPIAEVVEIVWNGVVLASASSAQLEDWGVSTFSVEVEEDGQVSVSFANVSLSAQIPDEDGVPGLSAADQSDWTFSFAGRTGGNGGEVWIDDISLTANINCFASGTLIDTDRGPVAVEELRPGDRVVTRDNGLQPVRWVASRHLSPADLAARPQLCPVRLRRGALGPELPQADLLVSPQHRLLVRSAIVSRIADTPEALVAAKHLLGMPGVELVPPEAGITYHHVMFDRHEVIRANGSWAESLLIGPQLTKTVSLSGFLELAALFPELAARMASPAPARECLRRRTALSLVRRHLKNDKPLFSEPTRQCQSA